MYAGDSFCQYEDNKTSAKHPLLGPMPALSPKNIVSSNATSATKKSNDEKFSKSTDVGFFKSKTLNSNVIDSIQSSAQLTNQSDNLFDS